MRIFRAVLLTLFLQIITMIPLYSQIIWTETFSNGCVSGCLATTYGGWTETTTGTNDANYNRWYVSGSECGNNVGACGTNCGGTDPSLHISNYSSDSRAVYANNTTNRRIQSPVINCTGYSNVMLSFNFIHNGNSNGPDECAVQYYDGSSWTNLGTLPKTVGVCSPEGHWTNYTIQLPASANNNPNVRIGFNWKNNDDGVGTDPSVAIDDIVLFVKPTVCYNSGFAPYNGGGCTNNCILSEYSGFTSMCTSFLGCSGCPSTGPVMTQLFTIPSGCTATLTAAFQRRCNGIGCSACTYSCNGLNASSGCCNSGMDGNDYLKVGGSLAPVSTNTINLSGGYTSVCGSAAGTTAFSTSGNTITATGSNNGGAVIEYVQTGGILFLEGRSNRMDEITTFTLAITNTCSCSDILPVDILSFGADVKNNTVELKWLTKSERHLSHYRLEKSRDGVHFAWFVNVPSGNSEGERIYSVIDDNPYEGISYYKLTAVTKDSVDEKYILRDVFYQLDYQPFSYQINEDEIKFLFACTNNNGFFKMYDISGKEVYRIDSIDKMEYGLDKNTFQSGIYIGVLFDGKKYIKNKVVIY